MLYIPLIIAVVILATIIVVGGIIASKAVGYQTPEEEETWKNRFKDGV